MATLLPDEPATAHAVADARQLLSELRARPYLARLDAVAGVAAGDEPAVLAQA